jgi:hypothetical protein
VHWVRDEQMRPPTDERGRRSKAVGEIPEDRSRVRSGSALQVLASERNLVMNWLRSRKVHAIAETLRESA